MPIRHPRFSDFLRGQKDALPPDLIVGADVARAARARVQLLPAAPPSRPSAQYFSPSKTRKTPPADPEYFGSMAAECRAIMDGRGGAAFPSDSCLKRHPAILEGVRAYLKATDKDAPAEAPEDPGMTRATEAFRQAIGQQNRNLLANQIFRALIHDIYNGFAVLMSIFQLLKQLPDNPVYRELKESLERSQKFLLDANNNPDLSCDDKNILKAALYDMVICLSRFLDLFPWEPRPDHPKAEKTIPDICRSSILRHSVSDLVEVLKESLDFLDGKEKVEIFDLRTLFSGIESFAKAMDPSVDFSVAHDAGKSLTVSGSRAKFMRIFGNLIKNALEAMAGRPDRRIAVSASINPGSSGSHASETEIHFEDSGPGFSEEHRALAFTSHFSTRPNGGGRPGRGNGLFSIRHLSKILGGDIHLESSKSALGGAHFVLRFPLYDSQAVQRRVNGE